MIERDDRWYAVGGGGGGGGDVFELYNIWIERIKFCSLNKQMEPSQTKTNLTPPETDQIKARNKVTTNKQQIKTILTHAKTAQIKTRKLDTNRTKPNENK